MTDRDLIESHLRNMEAEMLYEEKAESNRLAFEVTTEKDGIIVTTRDYTKVIHHIPGLNTGMIFKERYVPKNVRR